VEPSVVEIERACGRLVGHGRSHHLAAHNAFQPEPRHQRGEALTACRNPFAVQLKLDFAQAEDAKAGDMDMDNLLEEPTILFRPHRSKIGISLVADVLVSD
jgi:hypothetical protein